MLQRIQSEYRACYKYRNIMEVLNLEAIEHPLDQYLRMYICLNTQCTYIHTYIAETTVLTSIDAVRLRVYERKIVSRIWGPKKIQGEKIRQLVKFEVEKIQYHKRTKNTVIRTYENDARRMGTKQDNRLETNGRQIQVKTEKQLRRPGTRKYYEDGISGMEEDPGRERMKEWRTYGHMYVHISTRIFD